MEYQSVIAFNFDGKTYERERDRKRLNTQYQRVFRHMALTGWTTLAELERVTGYPQASISARIRDMKKITMGGHTVMRRRRHSGTWEYKLVANTPQEVAT